MGEGSLTVTEPRDMAEEGIEYAPVDRVLSRRVLNHVQLVLILWEEPPGGFPQDAWLFENRAGLDTSPALRNASWRPRSSLIQPTWSVARYMSLPLWPQRLLTTEEEEAEESN